MLELERHKPGTLRIGPFKGPTGRVIATHRARSSVDVSKAGGPFTRSTGAGVAHAGDGFYDVAVPAGDTDAPGRLFVRLTVWKRSQGATLVESALVLPA